VLSAGGEYAYLVQEGDPINGGTEKWGHPETPDGTDIADIVGESYEGVGHNPDMNFFVSTTDDGTEGYLFTNNETTPGAITRTPISRTDDGSWDADLENAAEIENQAAFRDIGGTKINCYGDLSPWETPSPRKRTTAIRASTGSRRSATSSSRAAASACAEAASSTTAPTSPRWGRPRGHLRRRRLVADGALGEQRRREARLLSRCRARRPDGSGQHANAHRRRVPQPLSLRQDRRDRRPDRRRADAGQTPRLRSGRLGVSGGSARRADRLSRLRRRREGDLQVRRGRADPRVRQSNGRSRDAVRYESERDRRGPVAETDLEVEWLELGTASNAEVESWIADYDDITQVEYLETHAETDWEDDLETALAEADEEVAINGNRDYITDEEIVEWAAQYEEHGPDGVDEELRRVPFLETRAAAKEIGASIEFNKAEGIDSHDEAEPGDFIYFGISSLGGYMTDEQGELRFDEVESGVLYRAELEDGYDVSRLEPVVVGPNGSDPESLKDVSLINVDNVMMMDDGRVLLCEDKGSFGRSYPNDAMWVYEPPTSLHVDSVAVGQGRREPSI